MSSEAKKFLLIDSTNIDRLLSSPHFKSRLEPIEKRELKHIDAMMLAIVNNLYLTESEKVSEYNQALTEFHNTQTRNIPRRNLDQQKYNTNQQQHIDSTRITDPPQKDIQVDNAESANDLQAKEEQSTKTPYDVYAGIDHRYKPKAKQLLGTLKDDVKYTNTGEVLIRGEEIPGSNISNLLDKAVNPHTKFVRPKGWGVFASLLAESTSPYAKRQPKKRNIKSSPTLKSSQMKPKTRGRKKDIDDWEPFDS